MNNPMNSKVGDIVRKAFYAGVGLASLAGEKAGTTWKEAQPQVQKVLDELVSRGEMTAEEAQKVVADLRQQMTTAKERDTPEAEATEPRKIEILEDGEEDGDAPEAAEVKGLRKQVDVLRQQLESLKRRNS